MEEKLSDDESFEDAISGEGDFLGDSEFNINTMSFKREDIVTPKTIKFNLSDDYKYSDNIIDYSDLEELNKAINQARVALLRLTEKINKYQIYENKAKKKYERAYNRAYIQSLEKTDSMKRMHASISCEDLENEHFKWEQYRYSLQRSAQAVRSEMEMLNTLSNNLRQQLKSI